ncbi:MAG TPA: L-serine ammonia-lyase, iron-sulfur-dependent, subunit alpha [Propionibacteriaceae bacterium]|nr:L-serine ammonia-lyase, iron-sulfur-dependent, subunit alpha [Propionibacteriaceae bacterium]
MALPASSPPCSTTTCIVPAVLHYYDKFIPGADDDGVVRFLLTAAAVGILFKENASISGAEVLPGRGRLGVCDGGRRSVRSPWRLRRSRWRLRPRSASSTTLGLTCDPVGGLVQIPSIESNAMANSKVINTARIALRGDGSHTVSLDKAIRTMRGNRCRHEDQVQGDLSRRARGQRHRVLRSHSTIVV